MVVTHTIGQQEKDNEKKSHDVFAYALFGRGKMADGEGEPDLGAKDDNKRRMPPELVQHLRKTLRGLETRLREQAVCEAATVSYCKRFCQTLLQYAGEQNSSKNTLHLLEVYRISIQYFARARPFLAPECEDVLMVLGKLVLSCFEMLLSVPESELNYEEWLLFQQTLQASHGALSGFGHTNLQTLVDATKEGGVWKSPVVVKIITQQKVEPEEVAELIVQEGASFLELRIKHLMKTNCIPQAMVLSKLCTESSKTSNAESFRQSYISCLCTMLPNEDAIKEISKVDCREVLDIICNLETEGHDNTAFILCTTYLTQQLQTENIDCSWELTLFWSKLQRRIEPSLESFLERCRQFGVIAKTLQHLFFLIRVVHAEAEEEGLPISILLCVRALQIKSDENDMKASVCKTVACLLPHDLEVRRACQLTEFLLDPSEDAYNVLEALYLQPDQKFDEENAIVPNSLRCELLLALKAHWPFDPEFWDWKTLNRHCLKLLGKEVSESESEEQEACNQSVANDSNIMEPSLSDIEKVKEEHHLEQESVSGEANENKMRSPVGIKKPVGSSERYQRWLQYKFHCLICNRDVIEARILHHSKMHLIDGVYTCPVCVKKFKKKEVFVPHVMEHVKMPSRHRPRKKPVKKERIPRSTKETFSLMSSTSLGENNHPYVQPIDPSQYITFKQLEDYNLQDRDLYPCPGTGCSRIFKQFKYLGVHLKAEHQNNDENAKHYLDIKNKREKCGFCRRHFITDFHLHDHEQVHVGPQPYMCVSIDCFAKFGSVNELLNHKQTHAELQYKCELRGCNIIFSDLGQLYHHEAQHFRDASNACNFPGCKKFYFSKIEFENHLATHEIASTKVVSQVTNQLEERVAKSSENSQQTFQFHNKSDSIQSSDFGTSIDLPPDSSNSEMVSEVKMESDLNKNVNSESSQSTTEKPIALLENPTTVSLRADVIPHSQSERHNSRIVSNVRPNKFFVSPRLREQFNIFSVAFDGKKFTCGFEGCGVSRKNTRGMHKHLRLDHPVDFKPKKRTGMNARSLLQLFSANQKTKRPKKLGVRQEQSEKRDTFKRRRLVCNTNSRRKHVLKGGLCRPTAHKTANTVLPRVLSTEDVMLELLLGLKHLSLKNTCPDILSSTSLQKPISEPFQSFPSVCSASPSPNFSVDSKIFERNISEQDTFTNQCIAQLTAKPFYCELQGCKYSFVTKDALLVHYIKKHHYSKESVLQFSVFKDRFAPFQCHICQRAFTRRTHLSIHYRKKHQLAKMKLPQRLISARTHKESKSFPAPFETILNRNSNSCSVSAFRSTVDDLDDDDVDVFEQKMKHEMRHFNKEDYSSETDNDSQSEEMDSNSGEKPTFLLQDRHRGDLELMEGRGSKRTAKGDLCYILNKYHKPFHCVHKGCSSSFTNQSGLIRHYRLTHRYNKEQLCLEKDRARSKSNYTKYKKIFVCKFQDCNKRFLGSKALGKHCRDIHKLYNGGDQRLLSVTHSARFSCDQPKCLAMFYTFDKLKHHQLEDHSTEIMQNKDIEIRCELNGCDRLFTHHNTYSKHVFYSHRECYDDIFGRPDELEDNILEGEESGVDKKPDLLRQKRQFHTNRKKIKKIDRRFGKRGKTESKGATQFRTREEAVNMCLEEVKHTQFPCMVHGCLSVVKLESSIVRHYKRSHFFSNGYIEDHYQNLVLCVKYGAKEKGESHLEVHAKEYNMHRSNKRKKCLLENDFHYRDKENENHSNAVGSDLLFSTESFLCKSMLKYKNSSNTACVGDHMSESSFCNVEQNYPGTKEKENKSRFSSFQVPLKRKKGCDERERGSAYAVASKDNCQKQSLVRTFDLKSFKPMGFESSFLKFIQEREHKDEYFEEQTEWEPEKYCASSFGRNTSDMQNNNFVDKKMKEVSIPKRLSESLLHRQVAACHTLSAPTETSTVPSLQNLRSILDKALTDCGDLALKQLHYLRPVVVLERSKFSAHLVDLFPAKKTTGLCVGSS